MIKNIGWYNHGCYKEQTLLSKLLISCGNIKLSILQGIIFRAFKPCFLGISNATAVASFSKTMSHRRKHDSSTVSAAVVALDTRAISGKTRFESPKNYFVCSETLLPLLIKHL